MRNKKGEGISNALEGMVERKRKVKEYGKWPEKKGNVLMKETGGKEEKLRKREKLTVSV